MAWRWLWGAGPRLKPVGRAGGPTGYARMDAAVLAVLGAFFSLPSFACTGSGGSDFQTKHVVVQNGGAADVVLTRWMEGNTWNEFAGCGPSQRVAVRFTPSMGGLTYVRHVTVDGMSHPAYAWSSTSPLIVFRLFKGAVAQAASANPPQVVSIDAPSDGPGRAGGTSSVNNNKLYIKLQFALLSRGIPMTGGTLQTLRGQTMLTSHPGAGSIQSMLDLTVDVQSRTCTLSDTTLVLDDVRSHELGSGDGSTAGKKPLNIRMNCPSAGTRVTLKADDTRGSTQMPGQLTPGQSDTASGVRIQLLRNGQPLRFGQTWDFGTAPAGDTLIALEAQYVRFGAAFGAGTITGEARLTADYL